MDEDAALIDRRAGEKKLTVITKIFLFIVQY